MSNSMGIGVFVVYKKKLLLLLRDDRPDILWPGTWSLLGGGIEKSETALKAAKREVTEEIGLKKFKLQYLGTHRITERKNRKTYYFLESKRPLGKVCEGCAHGFFDLEALQLLATLTEVKGGLGGAMKTIFMKYPDALKALLNGDSGPIKNIPEFGVVT